MRTSMTLLGLILCGSAALACGDGEALPTAELAPTTGPAIQLHPLDLVPGCYVPPPTDDPSADGPQQQLIAVARQNAEFRWSYATQIAQLFLSMVEKDPTALRWQLDTSSDVGSTHLEGWRVADGADWSVLEMIAVLRWNDRTTTYRAELSSFPDRLIVDFGTERLEFADNFVRYGDHVRGCDPRNGWSFEVGPALVNGQLVDDAARCWSGSEPIAGQDSADQGEFHASAMLQCLQVIEGTQY